MKEQLCKSSKWNQIERVYDKLRHMKQLVNRNISITAHYDEVNKKVIFGLEV